MTLDEAFSILGVTRSADFEEVRCSYRELVKRWHPDRHEGLAEKKLAERQLQRINQAFSFLETSFRSSQQINHGEAPKTSSSTPDAEDATRPEVTPPSTRQNPEKKDIVTWFAICGIVVLCLFLLFSYKEGMAKPGWRNEASRRLSSASLPESLSGRWRTAKGDILKLSETNGAISIQLLSSPNMLSGSGYLQRSGTALNGTLEGRFKDSPSRVLTSGFKGVITNDRRIDYTVEVVFFDAYGNVNSRSSTKSYMIKD